MLNFVGERDVLLSTLMSFHSNMLNAPSHNYPDEQHATVCVTHESCEWASHIMCASDRLHKRTQGKPVGGIVMLDLVQ